MRCNEVRSIVDEVGDLDRLPVEAARHVGACDECERFGRELVALRALLREPGRVAVTPDFDSALARRIRAAKAPARERAGLAAWFALPTHALGTAAAVGLLAVGTFTMYEISRPLNTSVAAPGDSRTVATNVAPVEPPRADPPSEAADVPSPVARTTAAPVVPVRYARPAQPRAQAIREVDAGPSEAMMLISDGRGTRVVSVPTVLVGSERALPSNAAAAAAAPASSGVSF